MKDHKLLMISNAISLSHKRAFPARSAVDIMALSKIKAAADQTALKLYFELSDTQLSCLFLMHPVFVSGVKQSI